MTLTAIQEALQPVVRMLAVEDYHLSISGNDDAIQLEISAGEAACSYCLVSKSTLRSIALDHMTKAGYRTISRWASSTPTILRSNPQNTAFASPCQCARVMSCLRQAVRRSGRADNVLDPRPFMEGEIRPDGFFQTVSASDEYPISGLDAFDLALYPFRFHIVPKSGALTDLRVELCGGRANCHGSGWRHSMP
jgi:hypothetical protein